MAAVTESAIDERITELKPVAEKIIKLFKKPNSRQDAVDLLIEQGKGIPSTRGLATTALLAGMVWSRLPDEESRGAFQRLLGFDAV